MALYLVTMSYKSTPKTEKLYRYSEINTGRTPTPPAGPLPGAPAVAQWHCRGARWASTACSAFPGSSWSLHLCVSRVTRMCCCPTNLEGLGGEVRAWKCSCGGWSGLPGPFPHSALTRSAPRRRAGWGGPRAEFSKFAGILSAALSQHHLSGFGIAQLEFHHLH